MRWTQRGPDKHTCEVTPPAHVPGSDWPRIWGWGLNVSQSFLENEGHLSPEQRTYGLDTF